MLIPAPFLSATSKERRTFPQTRTPTAGGPADSRPFRGPGEHFQSRRFQFHIETLIIYKLSPKKFTTQNDLYQ
jgi:hypothetical protein